MTPVRTADLYFDPSCPYTWLTSRWLLDVAAHRDVEIRWRILSLSVLNEHLDEDPEGDTEGYLWYPVRLAAAVEAGHGQAALGRFYTALGERIHREDGWSDDTFPAALEDAGLPRDLANAAGDAAWEPAVRASTAEGVALVGKDVGSPIIATTTDTGDPVAFFGPVVSAIPRGEAALRLWDGVRLAASVATFNELKVHPRGKPDPS
ncbi:DSBA oxidoreductase [Actinomadura flavalba]|uniref:mycothiol-dependent nitroreductase Rv2466c family protein n=1 Tax=Actinomadura flavalba TaxID=1120938 RepID=UPI000475EE5C|nr:DSBA oxidoreductase [Actinomadura flavalba]